VGWLVIVEANFLYIFAGVYFKLGLLNPKPVSPLEKETSAFFALHWCKEHISGAIPQWTTWNLNGIPPEACSGGCYAIYAKAQLLYIGVAVTEGKNAGKNGKKYGLLDRLKRHVIQKDARQSSRFIPHKKYVNKWNGMTSIRLIGFSDEYRHLAAALEIYLIKRLAPPINAQTRWREGQLINPPDATRKAAQRR
jgi:hypothetical protein